MEKGRKGRRGSCEEEEIKGKEKGKKDGIGNGKEEAVGREEEITSKKKGKQKNMGKGKL